MFRILVVCRANVCRSAAAGALLVDRLEQWGAADLVEVSTAGTDADRPEGGACQEILATLPDAITARLAEHVPTQATRELVAAADLVLTADRRARAAVLHDDPTAHDRVFTLRHAVELAAAVEQPAMDAVDAVDREAQLRAYVTRLHQARGRTGRPTVEMRRVPRRPWQRVRIQGHDVPDAHPGGALHPLVADLLTHATTDLGRHLAEAALPRTPSR